MALPHLSPQNGYRFAGFAGRDALKAVDLHQSAVQNKAEPFAASRRGRARA